MVNSRGDQVNIALLHILYNYGNSATGGSPKTGLCSTFIGIFKNFL